MKTQRKTIWLHILQQMKRLIANHNASLTYGLKMSKLLVLKGQELSCILQVKTMHLPTLWLKIQRLK